MSTDRVVAGILLPADGPVPRGTLVKLLRAANLVLENPTTTAGTALRTHLRARIADVLAREPEEPTASVWPSRGVHLVKMSFARRGDAMRVETVCGIVRTSLSGTTSKRSETTCALCLSVGGR